MANDISIKASGAGHAHLADLSVTDAAVSLSGASTATLNANGRIDGDLRDASRLKYIGNLTLGSISTSGGSTIRQK